MFLSILHPNNSQIMPDDGRTGQNIGRNATTVRYDISTLLFGMRGMSVHYIESYALRQKSNGYLIKQTITTLDSTVRAISDGSTETTDTSFLDTLPTQTNRPSVESDE